MYVGRVCCWFSPLLREVFLQVLSPQKLLKISKLQSDMDQADEEQQVELLSLNHCLRLLFYFNLVRG